MEKSLTISQSVFESIAFLPVSDRRKIIDTVMMCSFEDEYKCSIDGHNLAIANLVLKLLAAQSELDYHKEYGQ